MFRWFKLQKRLEDLEETVEGLQKEIKKLEVEWTDTYDKFRQLHMRVAKRVQRLDQAPGETGDPQPEGGSVEAAQGNSMLSPRARLIQAQILARRNARPNGGTE